MNQMMYLQMIKSIRDTLPLEQRESFDMNLAGRGKSPTTALMLSLFLGGIGVDRFYLGDVGLGIGKLITFGGLGIWAITDFFIITGAARRRNVRLASEIKMMLS